MGIAAIMLLFLGQDWDDALFWILAALMIIAGLLVVTMHDIIRCGLAMIVCFGALAGIYVLMGAPLIGAAQVIVYIGAISVLILFAIMLTQTKDAPTRLVFQTQAGPAAVASVVIAVLIALAVAATDWGACRGAGRSPARATSPASCSPTSSCRSRSSACCCWRRSSVASSSPSASRADRREQQPRRLPGPRGPALRDRLVRVPRPAQRDQHADVDRADAQRRQPLDRGVRRVHPGARAPGLGHRPHGHGRRRGRGDRRAWRSSSPSTATRRRRSSTSTTRCADEAVRSARRGAADACVAGSATSLT